MLSTKIKEKKKIKKKKKKTSNLCDLLKIEKNLVKLKISKQIK